MGTKQKPTKIGNPDVAARGLARREALGLSRIELAYRMDVTTNRLVQMETEGVQGLSTIKAWAKALDMDAVELAFGVQSKKGKAK